ncbi:MULTISPECIES: HAD family hydrolase [Niastella]|uniref:HAD family phosphatase n=1 Tax=Niastella soli TaxID=2821487 RepID=A0ABS3YX21_9BACT|nr:HAD family hydrolase [Niastella soli]MBO9201955.1 HAD family phosphatase [Niastella soli]
MIKLIVTDLDGTLLTDNHEVPDRFWKIASRLFDKGIKLGIATGRPHFSITEKFQAIVDQLYAISDNGSLIIHEQTELLSKSLPKHEIEALVIAARSVDNAWPILCGRDQWYLENSDEVLMNAVLAYHSNFKIVDDLTKIDEEVLKMTVYDYAGSEQNSYPQFKHFENRLKVVVGGAKWLDITRTDVNKGEAVQILQSLNGISPDETLVFGDFMNDYEMMKTATYSYAMKNANPKLIEAANFVTEKDNNEAGILDVIELLCFNEC